MTVKEDNGIFWKDKEGKTASQEGHQVLGFGVQE